MNHYHFLLYIKNFLLFLSPPLQKKKYSIAQMQMKGNKIQTSQDIYTCYAFNLLAPELLFLVLAHLYIK